MVSECEQYLLCLSFRLNLSESATVHDATFRQQHAIGIPDLVEILVS